MTLALLLTALIVQTPSCLALDTDRSTIRWRGTKFFGLGSHEGTVRLKGGELCIQGGSVAGGWFVADMTTIEVTDIPANDPVPRNRLRNHLLGEDFFDVRRHPEARFRIASVVPQNGRLFQVVGALTIRDRTHSVRFYARGWTVSTDRVEGTARFAVDRHDYGVSYVGSTIKDDLVDDQFWLEIDIRARRP